MRPHIGNGMNVRTRNVQIAAAAEEHADAARQYRREADSLDAVAAMYERQAPAVSQRDASIARLLRKAAEGLRRRAYSEDEAASHAAAAG